MKIELYALFKIALTIAVVSLVLCSVSIEASTKCPVNNISKPNGRKSKEITQIQPMKLENATSPLTVLCRFDTKTVDSLSSNFSNYFSTAMFDGFLCLVLRKSSAALNFVVPQSQIVIASSFVLLQTHCHAIIPSQKLDSPYIYHHLPHSSKVTYLVLVSKEKTLFLLFYESKRKLWKSVQPTQEIRSLVSE